MTKLIALVLAVAACSTDSTEQSVSPLCEDATTHSDFAWIQTNLFEVSCVLGGCHAGAAVNADHLSLEAGSAYIDLVNAPATTIQGWKRVTPGDPSKSYLMVALGAEPGMAPPDGPMPLSSPGLCPEQLDALERWITAGATQ